MPDFPTFPCVCGKASAVWGNSFTVVKCCPSRLCSKRIDMGNGPPL
ncbi:hypothetical protein EVA_05049 [gut metagenome]|uniref:Uncharacterized protein n=1 Tax=gut metagenome TaxID=749906 RepID=J9D2J4_9ZZZZ